MQSITNLNYVAPYKKTKPISTQTTLRTVTTVFAQTLKTALNLIDTTY